MKELLRGQPTVLYNTQINQHVLDTNVEIYNS